MTTIAQKAAQYDNLMSVLTGEDGYMVIMAALPELHLSAKQAGEVWHQLLLHLTAPPVYRIVRCTAKQLNVRSWPEIAQNIVGTIIQDQTAEVRGKVGDWLLIRADETLIGWASAAYLEDTV